MTTLLIEPLYTPDGYDRSTRKLYQRPVRYSIDGWPLLAESYGEALREAELMGEKIDRVETAH